MPNILDLEYMPYVQGDIIVMDVLSRDLRDNEIRNVSDIFATLLTRSPQHIYVPRMDAKGNMVGLQVIWLSYDLLVELHDCEVWPIVQVDQNGKTQLCFSRR